MKTQKTFNIKRCLCVGAFIAIALCGIGVSYLGETKAAVDSGSSVSAVEPKITIDPADGYSLTSIPYAVKGEGYRVFEASAVDAYGSELEVEKRVYLFYSSETRSRVYLKNGEFTPTQYGIYTVEYSATDLAGTTAIATYEVVCQEKEALTATVESEVETCVVGTEVQLSGLNYENAIGTTSYAITATHSEGKVVYELGDDNSFVPMYVGDYTVEYAYSDYNETNKVSYTLKVTEREEPVIFNKVNLPKYFLVGCSYDLPLPECYSFSLGKPVKVQPSITIAYKSGKTLSLESTKFTPQLAGEFSLIYTATFDGVSSTDSYELVAVDVEYTGELKMENYLYGDDVIKTATSSEIELTTAKDGASVEFVNAILAENLTIEFAFDVDQNNFNELEIWLTDSVNPEEQLKISVRKDKTDSSDLYLNDQLFGNMTNSFFNSDNVSLSYANASRSLFIGNSDTVVVKSANNGDEFKGFSSRYVYVKFAFAGVEGNSKVSLSKINNQVLFNEGDSNSPVVVYSRYTEGKRQIGDMIEIAPVYVGDVLTPTYALRYYVKSPDGSYTIDENGVVLSPDNTIATNSYRFVARQIGRYLVTIAAGDGFGNEYTYSYAVTVVDKEAPILRISSTKSETVKVGSYLNVRSATVSDNISEDISIFVYVIDPYGIVTEYNPNENFKLEYEGKYFVQYYAFDEAGNTAIKGYTVTVK